MIPSRKRWHWPLFLDCWECRRSRVDRCGECASTRLDAIPWSELFKSGRGEGGPLMWHRREYEK